MVNHVAACSGGEISACTKDYSQRSKTRKQFLSLGHITANFSPTIIGYPKCLENHRLQYQLRRDVQDFIEYRLWTGLAKLQSPRNCVIARVYTSIQQQGRHLRAWGNTLRVNSRVESVPEFRVSLSIWHGQDAAPGDITERRVGSCIRKSGRHEIQIFKRYVVRRIQRLHESDRTHHSQSYLGIESHPPVSAPKRYRSKAVCQTA